MKRYMMDTSQCACGHCGPTEDLNGDYYSRADLIAAGCLVPVPDGEAVELDQIQRHQYVQWEGHVCVPDKLRRDLVRITDNHRHDVRQQYCDSFRFTPVRLVPLEDVG
jgi:hypothetical protein